MTNKATKTMTSLPVKDLLKISMKHLGLKNVELAGALDYPRPNVVSMMKNGTMQLPANKVRDAARVLQLDPVFLLGKVVGENDPELWDVISTLLGRQLVTANEIALIKYIRQALDGNDIDLTKEPGFVNALLPRLQAIVARQTALNVAAIRHIEKGRAKAKYKVPSRPFWM